MDKYAQISLSAMDKIQSLKMGPVRAWQDSALEVYPSNKDARDKSCPKCAFLGLCEDGYVKGVSKGNYTTSRKNKGYAIAGLDIIKAAPDITPGKLWLTVIKKKTPKHNGQMEVVKALFDRDYLKT